MPQPSKFSQTCKDASPGLERVRKGGLCAGCGACQAVAPDRVTLRDTPGGLPRPVQTGALTAGEEQTLEAICPGLGQRIEAGGRRDHVLWGPVVQVQTGWARDPEERFAGASGGALTAILVTLLETGTVDGVLQVTADPDRPWGNVTTISRDPAAVRAAAGSRYAPSSPFDRVPELLARHRRTQARFAFVGKPCDAAALRAWAARDAEVAAAFPVVLSFFCGGVPSDRGAAALLAAMGVDPARVSRFRYRGMGWPGAATATLETGEEAAMSYHESWGKVLSRHVQHRCKICADGAGAAADIVCADAWETDARGYPLFAERPGVSLVMARTALGARLVAAAEARGAIALEDFDLDGLAAIQPGQVRRRTAVLARLLAQRLTGRPVPAYAGLHLRAAARHERLSRHLRSFLGMLRRSRGQQPD